MLPVELLEPASIGSLYDRTIVETEKEPELFFLLSFILTFGFIRTSAHMIRAEVSWWPGNVEVGGTHIHHLVWGILLLLVVGYFGVAVGPDSPWREVIAILFGVGAGLTLDEFALWLTLRDVYWEQEGRRSIDAVIVATAFAGVVLLGFKAWVDVATGVTGVVFHLIGWSGLLTILLALVNLAKEKYGIAILGMLAWPIAALGALRLGRPESPWARYYDDDKRARAERRFAGRSRWPIPKLPRRRAQPADPGSGAA